MTTVEGETEEQAEARIRARRCAIALRQAPELVRHIREQIEAADRLERGEFAGEFTPLVTQEADEADEVFARLLEWVVWWAETLGTDPPSVAIVAWSRVDEDSRAASPEREVLGFRAGTTPAGAEMLVRLLATWLAVRADRIAEHDTAATFQEDVRKLVWGFRARYGLSAGRERAVHPRACPVCGELGVGATWLRDELLAVEISCEHCHYVIPTPKASDVERWLGESVEIPSAVSLVCERGRHRKCEAVNCSCTCHAIPDVVVGMGAETPMPPTKPRPSLPPSTAPVDPRVCSKCQLIHPEGACDG